MDLFFVFKYNIKFHTPTKKKVVYFIHQCKRFEKFHAPSESLLPQCVPYSVTAPLPNKKLVAQRIMVKTTSRSDGLRSAIFCVIVYLPTVSKVLPFRLFVADDANIYFSSRDLYTS